jgi:sigma-B regulation protein RsbU (phosphoserine phosphatase)
VVHIIEASLLVLVFGLAFARKQPLALDVLGRRGELLLVLVSLAIFAVFHSLVKRHLLGRIERYFEPAPYQQRAIFLDLGQGLRNVSSVDELYQVMSERIREALEADNVSVFVREELSGDYCLRASAGHFASSGSGAGVSSGDAETNCRLKSTAFIARRLASLTTPLTIEPNDLSIWSQAMSFASPDQRSARAQESQALLSVKARLLVQIRRGERLAGILSLGPRRGGFQYSVEDKELLVSIAAQLALAIENAHLTERIVVQERFRRELALAAEVQQRLLPPDTSEGTAVELAGFCEPARGVGGDYYDFISVDQAQIGIAIADVAGKGMPAALVTSTVQATLRSLTADNGPAANAEGSLGHMVGKMNRLLCNSTSGHQFVTFFYARFDKTTQLLTYVNAGHNPPLHVQSNGSLQFRELTCGGLIAGVFEKSGYDQETFQMRSNDLLFMYTDGLTEALNSRGEEFGESRVRDTLAETAGLSVKQIRDEFVRRVKAWGSDVPLYDDLTFVVMKVK